MESYLKNIEVWCWVYTENVRNYPGLHLTARADACDALVKCLSQLRQEGNGARRTIPLLDLAPEHAAKIAGNQKYVSFSKIRISLHESSDSLRQMSFRREGESALLDFTEPFLGELEEGLADVRSGMGDYCIHPDDDRKSGLLIGELDKQSEPLWFWPCFGHLGVV